MARRVRACRLAGAVCAETRNIVDRFTRSVSVDAFNAFRVSRHRLPRHSLGVSPGVH